MVSILDWGIVAFTLALALWGYHQGLIVGVTTLAGFALGAFLGSRIAPELLDGGAESPYAPLFAALGGVLLGTALGVGLEGFAHNLRLRFVRGPRTHALDGTLGAALIACVALGVVWVFGAVALHTPGTPGLRRGVQQSVILRALNETLPPSGPIINALNRVDPAPSVEGPVTDVAPPDPAVARLPEVKRAGASVVRVLGTACGLGIEGSGWVAAPGLVVTNAHVVAGEDDTSVTTLSGASMDAQVVTFDVRNDLAVLRIGALLPVLGRGKLPEQGADAAVLGYPENGPYRVAAARFGNVSVVISQDAYGRGSIRRSMVAFRGNVMSGNSGGPLVDSSGRVLGTVFAATKGGHPGGFAVPNGAVAAALAAASDGPVDTGPCTG